jgi:hypothetical protein
MLSRSRSMPPGRGLREGEANILMRSRIPVTALVLSVLLLVGCTARTGADLGTGESHVTLGPVPPTVMSPDSSVSVATGSTAGPPLPAVTSSSGTSGSSAPTAAPPVPGPTSSSAGAPAAGFTPSKLAAGAKAPQFIVVSFDGVGRHDRWQYFEGIAARVPFRFTGFLTGVYLLDDAAKTRYQAPGHQRGRSSLGSWNSQDDVAQEIVDLNTAYQLGDEIGTHFNGHYCSDNPPGGNAWSTADWNAELDQFFAFLTDYRSNNGLPPSTQLAFGPQEIKGARTPCLEGTPAALFPALKAHGMTYDSSFTRRGISWPTRSPRDGIWQLGMAEFPLHGTTHFQVTMDYNFYFTQHHASSAGVTPEQSAVDSAQVQATYQDMYDATMAGNRAPLILGNHFNAWNNNAYTDGLGRFLLANCGRPDTYCVPFRDVITWMELQDPAVLSALQKQPPESGPPA